MKVSQINGFKIAPNMVNQNNDAAGNFTNLNNTHAQIKDLIAPNYNIINFTGQKIAGEQHYVDFIDKNHIAEIENVSDPKVGSKFILTFKDPKYNGLRILIKPETKIESKDGSFELNVKPRKDVSFTGSLYGSIRKNEDGSTDKTMENAYQAFYEKGMYDNIMTGHVDKRYAPQLKNDYNFYIPTDGDGTRIKDVTRLQGGVTKPAMFIPATLNNEQMRLINIVQTNFARTGKLDDDVDFIHVTPALGSAYGFFEGLKNGTIPTNSPLVFAWGDNFADINVAKLLKYHEDNDSDFTLLSLPVDKQRIKALGAFEVKSQNDYTVSWFKEKPETQEEIERSVVPGTDKCLGSVGPYVLSTSVLKWLKEEYTENPESFKNEKGYDFSSRIIARIVNEENLLNESGKPVKVMAYQKPESDTWSDLGAEKDFGDEMGTVKKGHGYKNLPEEITNSISKNIDENNNISFDKKAANMLKQAQEEYGFTIENAYCFAL